MVNIYLCWGLDLIGSYFNSICLKGATHNRLEENMKKGHEEKKTRWKNEMHIL
jgi:hypothetical protein